MAATSTGVDAVGPSARTTRTAVTIRKDRTLGKSMARAPEQRMCPNLCTDQVAIKDQLTTTWLRSQIAGQRCSYGARRKYVIDTARSGGIVADSTARSPW